MEGSNFTTEGTEKHRGFTEIWNGGTGRFRASFGDGQVSRVGTQALGSQGPANRHAG